MTQPLLPDLPRARWRSCAGLLLALAVAGVSRAAPTTAAPVDWAYVSSWPASAGPAVLAYEEAWLSPPRTVRWRRLTADGAVLAAANTTADVERLRRALLRAVEGTAPSVRPRGSRATAVDGAVGSFVSLAIGRDATFREWADEASFLPPDVARAVAATMAAVRPSVEPRPPRDARWLQARPADPRVANVMRAEGRVVPFTAALNRSPYGAALRSPFAWLPAADRLPAVGRVALTPESPGAFIDVGGRPLYLALQRASATPR